MRGKRRGYEQVHRAFYDEHLLPPYVLLGHVPGTFRGACLRCGHVSPWRRHLASLAVGDVEIHMADSCLPLRYPVEIPPALLRAPDRTTIALGIVDVCWSCEQVRVIDLVVYADEVFQVCTKCLAS